MVLAKVVQGVGPTGSEEGGDAPPVEDVSRPARAFRNTVLSVLSQGVVSGTNFLTTVAVGRACGQETLGNYALTLSILLFLRAVQSDVIGSAYTVYCSRRRGEEGAAYAGSTLVHQLTLSGAAFAGLLGLAAALSLSGGSAGLTSAVWALLGAVPFLLLRDQIRQFAFAHLRLGTVLALDAAAAVLQLGSLAVLAYFRLLNAETAYAVMGGACALICLAWFLFGGQPLRFDRGRLLPDWRYNWAFARWALASQLISRAAGYLMPWVVAAVHGEAATGMLAACVSLVNIAGTFITGVSSYLAPRAAHAVSSGGVVPLRRVLAQTAALYLVVVGGFCLVVLVGGDSLTSFVYGSRFAGTGAVVAVLAFAMLANSMSITVGNGLYALDRPRANFAADAVTLVATAGVLAALVGPLGVMGAALATLAGSVAGAAVRAVTLWRLIRPAPAARCGMVSRPCHNREERAVIEVLAASRKQWVPARLWLLGAASLFVTAVFYLAEPLDLRMSASDVVNLDDSDVTTMDQVETNIQANEEGNRGRQAALAGLAALGLILMLRPSESRLRLGGLLALAALFFLAWSAASVFWSGDALVTVRKLAVLACLCLGAVGLAKWLSLRELMLFTLCTTGLLLAVGMAAEFALGTFRPWIGSYRFSGLTWPAFSAWDGSLFVLAAVALWRTAGRYRTALGLAAAAAVALVLLTKTRASAGALFAAGLVYVAFSLAARRQLIAAVVVCTACSLGLLVAELSGGKPLDGLIDAVNLGRTESAADISGRAGLWRDVGPYVAERPLGGYGYESFWTPQRLFAVGEDNWGAPDAHNSFINLTLGVGVVGTAAYSLVLALGLWRARTRHRETSDIGYLFCVCAIVVLIGNALFVSTWLAPALYSFITMTLIARLGFVAPGEPRQGAET